ncbi:MSMEG_0570 family nitrogen starvation response protein [Agaribacter marinus]|uniref:MSMEG_0570 family nitrogen starvation response protein n=1 Tax=Agaribacter marinus TaxID=1431249 RepID=A0AA37T2S9_9ALTE|nr:MSMEG_0570 family nitrogen starvation response protein [Agaribacter marinus]GLR71228.1 hypothetical protein GCM10007852_21360 [Agaribacter marinus]
MPEKRFEVRWPDGEVESCYSPSSVISQYFRAGQTLSLDEFVNLSEQGLKHASKRVEETYGYACSSAMDQLSRIQRKAKRLEAQDALQVHIISVG